MVHGGNRTIQRGDLLTLYKHDVTGGGEQHVVESELVWFGLRGVRPGEPAGPAGE